MRAVQTSQMSFGGVDISTIKLDPRSRDDIPVILVGLQHIYTTPILHNSVFEILQQIIPKKSVDSTSDFKDSKNVSSTLARPGMENTGSWCSSIGVEYRS
ncbi:MAG: hypothetical protein KZQ70_05765 [gamma proteobacterium symbiont of Lucinoma myriamae]|nr:hypothetical protein [gamma proteobacterium symbiont of Lucinoma myriamae]MCU7832023.1 hypothetical protein [gamma proteobacterium symbiont of Lucinoma myriamae]